MHCSAGRIDFSLAGAPRSDRGSEDPVVNDAGIITRENIALCCIRCNASKGTKALADWLETTYCREREISRDSVAPVARDAVG